MIAGRSATVATVQSIRHELGLDRPLPVQYVSYLGALLRGDLGRSYAQRAKVSDLIASRFAPTVQLALAGILFELLIGLPEEDRSEEHTSELQSRENLVCRLLLEKKKKR